MMTQHKIKIKLKKANRILMSFNNNNSLYYKNNYNQN